MSAAAPWLVIDSGRASLAAPGAAPRLLWTGALDAAPAAEAAGIVHRFIAAPPGVGEVATAVDRQALRVAGRFEPRDTELRLAALDRWPARPRHLVFDTPFFDALPPAARHYALPPELAAAHGLYRRGRHGPVHRRAAGAGRCVSVVLAECISVAALRDGAPVEVSCGVSGLEGVPGAHSVGDIDPAAVLYLVENLGLGIDGAARVLGSEGGLDGLDDEGLARSLLIHRLRRCIGSYAAVLGGLDDLVFSGADDALPRQVAAGLQHLGAAAHTRTTAWTPLTAAMASASNG